MNKTYKFTNDYMFCYVLSSKPELAKELVELILGFEIESVDVIEQQKVLNYDTSAHSVRLDVYLKNSKEVFDVEMQTSDKHDLPKRMRYYQGANAYDDLKKGYDYNNLKNCYVIFLCTFDPFGKGDAIYRFITKNDKYEDIEFDDGAYSLIINSKSTEQSIPKELKNFLRYLSSGEVTDDFTSRIQAAVDQVNKNQDWRKWAMTLQQRETLRFNEGIFMNMIRSVKSLISKGKASNEIEACEYLDYDLSEYEAAKKVFEERKIDED